MLKVAVIGGGSSYTPELVNGFLERVASFPLTELWLMDVLQERLDVVGRFAQRMVAAAGSPFEVHLTTDQREAVRGASYVMTQLRVGWMAARREDEGAAGAGGQFHQPRDHHANAEPEHHGEKPDHRRNDDVPKLRKNRVPQDRIGDQTRV